MRNNLNTKVLHVDKTNYTPISVVKSEDNVTLDLELFKDNVALDITDQRITLSALRPDKVIVEQTDGFTKNGNKLKIELKNNIIAKSGIVYLEITVSDQKGSMTSLDFYLKVIRKILGQEVLEGSDNIASLEAIKEEFKKKIKECEEDYNSLKRVILDENQVANLQNKISNVYTKNEVDKKIFNMGNMGQDIKEAMTGGSVAVVGRDAVNNENIIDNQVSIEKVDFASYENQKDIFDGSFRHDYSIILDTKTGYYNINSSEAINNRWLSIIPIKENTVLRIKLRNNNRCRVGIAFESDLKNNFPFRASKMLIVDDKSVAYDSEFLNENGKFLIIYSGYQLENKPNLQVLERDLNAKIKFKNKLSVDIEDVNFIKKGVPANTALPYKTSNKIALATATEGVKKVYSIYTVTSKTSTFIVNLAKNCTYRIKSSNMNRCRIGLSAKEIVEAELPAGFNTLPRFEVEKLIYDDALEELDYTFNAGNSTQLVAYLGLNSTAPVNFTITSLEGKGATLSSEIKINGNEIEKESITKDKLAFDLSSSSSSAVNIPFWEVPEQPNTWATTPSGKDLKINSAEFLDLFFNLYLNKNYEDGYKVTKTVLGKDTSNTYDIHEFIFEPKNYTRTIIITAGNHPYELPAHFGFGRLIHYIMNEPDIHEGIRYLRDNVRIITIPLINPWGFSQSPKKYGNVNGVNINRNFDSNGRWASFPNSIDEWNQKGATPFSEKETQLLRDLYIKYADAAEWTMDLHCGVATEACDGWAIGLSSDKVLFPKVLNGVDMMNNFIRKNLKREPINKIVYDQNTSIRSWYSQEQLGLPNLAVEYVPQRYGGSMNGSNDLKYYLMYLSNYIFQALSFTADEVRHKQILLDRKLDRVLKVTRRS